MAIRNLLHLNKVEDFKKFLINKGWTLQEPTNIFEIIRATKPKENTIVLYQRGGTDHVSIPVNMPYALSLVKEFIYGNNTKINQSS